MTEQQAVELLVLMRQMAADTAAIRSLAEEVLNDGMPVFPVEPNFAGPLVSS